MRRLAGLIVVVIAVLIAVLVMQNEAIQNTDIYSCNYDSDCIAEQCCHATSAINKNFAPNCKEAICTMECRGGTLDCGYGEIKCTSKKCAVILK